MSAEAEMFEYIVEDGDDLLVIASDGLWDVLSSAEAVSESCFCCTSFLAVASCVCFVPIPGCYVCSSEAIITT